MGGPVEQTLDEQLQIFDDVQKMLNGEATEPYRGTCGSANLHGLTMDEHKKLCQAKPLIVYPCPPCKLACESLEKPEEHLEHCEAKIIRKSSDFIKSLPLLEPTIQAPKPMENWCLASYIYEKPKVQH